MVRWDQNERIAHRALVWQKRPKAAAGWMMISVASISFAKGILLYVLEIRTFIKALIFCESTIVAFTSIFLHLTNPWSLDWSLHQLSGQAHPGQVLSLVACSQESHLKNQETPQTLILYFGPFSFHLSPQKTKTCLTFYKWGPFLVPTLILLKGQHYSF